MSMTNTEILKQLLVELRKPFTSADISGGWTEEARKTAIKITEDAISQMNLSQECDASRHFVRWLDHMGVIDGPLFKKVAIAQQSILHS